ncbi:MAG: (2Fe-2S)-binding protein [Candidatus Solibacter usitatus]|nr:(2Fe-2S)-binding protein [Candidatus Solibacter usitatus]
MAAISFSVNGRPYNVDTDPDCPLLYVLNDELGISGPKFGCGLAQCGACTVLLDGQPIRSCTTVVSEAAGLGVTTIEGLGTPENPHPLQQAFIQEQAAQCGYCLSGIMLYGKTFVDSNPNATQEEILDALSGLICRCHAHNRMVRALQSYAKAVKA